MSEKQKKIKRAKLYKILIGRNRHSISIGFYRSVEDYRNLNPLPCACNYPKEYLSRSLRDWIYEDTGNREEIEELKNPLDKNSEKS